MIDYDQQDLDYRHEQSTNFNDEYQVIFFQKYQNRLEQLSFYRV